jgi:anti-sigma factor ChrR (cupin superfamily)
MAFSAWVADIANAGKEKPAMKVMVYAPSEIKWQDGPASIPPGAKLALLEGNPAKEGPFVMRLKLPDGYRIPPHTHPKAERLTVISGTFNIGMGEKFDEKAFQAMPAGNNKGTRTNGINLVLRSCPPWV